MYEYPKLDPTQYLCRLDKLLTCTWHLRLITKLLGHVERNPYETA